MPITTPKPLSVDEFTAMLEAAYDEPPRPDMTGDERLAAFRARFVDVRVALFPRHASSVHVLDSGEATLKVRLACPACRRERPSSPRRITVYVGRNDEDGAWSVAMTVEGHEVADLRTDVFYCGAHAHEILARKDDHDDTRAGEGEEDAAPIPA